MDKPLRDRVIVAGTDGKRIAILPRLYGNVADGIMFETQLFNAAEEMLEGYLGGCWTVGEVNGAPVFWLPHPEWCFRPPNGNDAVVDGWVAGVALSLYALNRMCWMPRYQNSVKIEKMYYALRDAMLSDSKLAEAVLPLID